MGRCVSFAGLQDGFLYTYHITPGRADKSYGIQVAQMAGLPTDVVALARATLDELEAHKAGAAAPRTAPATTPVLAPAPAAPAVSAAEAEALRTLRGLALDTLSPRAALDVLYALRDRLGAPTS